MPEPLPLGQVPQGQGRGKDAHENGREDLHTRFHTYIGRQDARCQCAGHAGLSGRRLLRDGQGLPRLHETLPDPPVGGIFFDQGEEEPQVRTGVFRKGRQDQRAKMRPDRQAYRILYVQGLSGKAKARKVP